MAWERELELAIEAAVTAGGVLRSPTQKQRAVLEEVGRDVKLQADRDAEEVILRIVRRSGHPILAEESGEHNVPADPDTPYWIVDPLDGTLNYSRGLPISSVSIALSLGDRPVLGVVYDFNRDELFSGVVGEGAMLNGKPTTVSLVDRPEKGLLTTGMPTHRDFGEASLGAFVREIQRFKKVRMLGSAALMLAYVACGRVDAYAEDEIMYWDVAAGVALVLAAGGWAEVLPSKQMKWARQVRCASRAALWSTP